MKQVTRKKLRFWIKLHTVTTGCLFGLYFLAGFFYYPGFLFDDIRGKISVFADTLTVTGKVLDAPHTPQVHADEMCSGGNMFVDLDWADDENTFTYDIIRNGSLLVSGIAVSQYQDVNISVGETYTYFVTAHGPMGSGVAASDEVSLIVSETCASSAPAPTVTFTALAGESTNDSTERVRIEDQTPTLSGTTTIPYGIVDILIHSDQVVNVRTLANANGYWSVHIGTKLAFGDHSATVTVTNPLDATQQITTFQLFRVVRPSEETKGTDKETHDDTESTHSLSNTPSTSDILTKAPPSLPFQFMLGVTNSDTQVFQGENLHTEILLSDIDTQYARKEGKIRYSVLNSQGEVGVFVEKNFDTLSEGQQIAESLLIPQSLGEGLYTLRAEIVLDYFTISHELNFYVATSPVKSVDIGLIAMYPHIVSRIGWISFVLLLSLLFWSLLWVEEYISFTRATHMITGKHLKQRGFMKTRKGVSR